VESVLLSLTGIATPPVNGTAVIVGNTIVYTPNRDFNGTDGLVYQVSDGVDTVTGTVSITIDPINDEPVLDLNSGTAGSGNIVVHTENVPSPVANSPTIIDVDSAGLSTLVITIDNAVPIEDQLEFAAGFILPPGMSATALPATSLTLSSATSAVAEFVGALAAVRFNNTSDTPDTVTLRTISVVPTDAVGLPGNTAIALVTVNAVNDPPDTGTDTYSIDEDIANTVLPVFANDTDIDGPGPLAFQGIDTSPPNGSAIVIGDTISYTPNPDFTGTDTLTYAVTDGGDVSIGTVTITVDPINDAPVLDIDSGTPGSDFAASFSELSGTAAPLTNGTVISDIDSTTATSAIVVLANGNVGDVLSIDGGAGALPAGIIVTSQNNTQIGLGSTSAVGLADWGAALDLMRFDNTISDPDHALRTVLFVLLDDQGDASNAASAFVAMDLVNDPPTLDLDGDAAGTGFDGLFEAGKPGGAVPIVDTDITITDDGVSLAGASVTLNNFQPGDVLSSLGALPAGIVLDPASTATNIIFTGNASTSDYEAALASVRFDNGLANPATVIRDIGVQLTDDGALPATATALISVEFAPVIDLNGSDQAGEAYLTSFTAGGSTPVTVVDGDVEIIDADSTELLTVVAELPEPAAGDSLFIDPADITTITATGITVSTTTTTSSIRLTLTGPADRASFASALTYIKFNNTAEAPNTQARIISFRATDTSSLTGRASLGRVAIGSSFAVDFEPMPEIALADRDLTYTVNIANADVTALADVVLTLVLDEEVFVVDSVNPGWDCGDFQAGANPTVICRRSSLAAGETTSVDVTILTPTESRRIAANAVVVNSDPASGTATASQETLVVAFDTNGFQHGEKIIDNPQAENASFGDAIAFYDDLLVVGSPNDQVAGLASGSVSMFRYGQGGWIRIQLDGVDKLEKPGLQGIDRFGAAVEFDGSNLLVGAPGAAEAFLYEVVFTDPYSATLTGQQLANSGAVSDDQFGYAAALFGDQLAVSAPAADGSVADIGRVHFFSNNGSAWVETQVLDPDGLPPGVMGVLQFQRFGHAVDLNGSIAVIGVPEDTGAIPEKAGRVLIYERDRGVLTYKQKLEDTILAEFNEFGHTLALDGKLLAVSSRFHSPSAAGSGAVTMCERGIEDWTCRQRLTASDAIAGEDFGGSLALQGNTLIVGAPTGLTAEAGTAASGTTYAFQFALGAWTQQQKRSAPDSALGDRFGSAVGLYADMMVVGVPADDDNLMDSGAVFSFRVLPATEIKLTAFDPTTDARFGVQVAVSGDTVVIGAPGASAGAVYIHQRDGREWPLQQKLTANGGVAGDLFGSSVAIDANRLVVGAPGKNAGDGGAVVFLRSGTVWFEQAVLLSDQADVSGDAFGSSVAVSGDWIAVGAENDNDPGINAGSVFVFENDGFSWILRNTLTASDPAADRHFGHTTSMDGDSMVVTANGVGGGAYVFTRSGSLWPQASKLTGPVGQTLSAAAISGDTIIGGDPFDATLFTNGGAAHIFTRPPAGWSAHAGTPDSTLFPSDAAPEHYFSSAVSIFAGEVMISAPGDAHAGTNSGAAYGFRLSGGIWLEQQKFIASDAQEGDTDGVNASNLTVAINRDARVMALPLEDGFNVGTDEGAAILFPSGTVASLTDGFYPGEQTLELFCSACDQILYTLNGEEPASAAGGSTLLYTGPIALTTALENALGTVVVKYKSVDASGNTETTKILTIEIDTTDPLVAITAPLDGEVVSTPITVSPISGTASDGVSGVKTGSGVSLVEVRIQHLSSGQFINLDDSGVFTGLTTEPRWLEASTTDDWATWSLVVNGANPLDEEGTYRVDARSEDVGGEASIIADSTFTFFTGTPLFTTTNLSLASSNIQSGSSIGLTMDLSVLADLGADLSSHDMCLTLTAPDLTVTEVLAHTDAVGFITISDLKATIRALQGGSPDFDFDQEGTYGFNAEFTATRTIAAAPGSVSGLSCATGALGTPVVSLQTSSSAKNLLVGSSPGYVILVQGRVAGDDLGLRSHNHTTNRIYEVLKSRGFDDANIFYFNHDTNQDGGVDLPGGGPNTTTGIDEVPTKAALQALLTDTASAPGSLAEAMNASPGPLYVVLVDHASTDGVNGTFYINPDDPDVPSRTITSSELAGWITTLEDNTANVDPVIPMIGACFSGSWIEDLSAPNRIVITSSTAFEESYRGPNEPVAVSVEPSGFLRTGEFFFEEFFKAAEQGNSLKRSFEVATLKTEEYTRRDSSGSVGGQFPDNAAQHPLLEDNGLFDPLDLGSNNLLVAPSASEPNPDGVLADTLFLGVPPGAGFATSTKGPVAQVSGISDTGFLGVGEDSIFLALTTPDDSLVQDAWIEVRSLNQILPAGSGGIASATFQVDNDVLVGGVPASVRLPLTHSAPLGFVAAPSVFSEPGKYRVFYYVQDVVTGDISPTRSSIVYKDSGSNTAAPTTPILSLPENLPAPAGTVTSPDIVFDWSDSTDDDVDPFTYKLEVATDPGFAAATIKLERDEIAQSYYFLDEAEQLPGGDIYYWRVTVTDVFGKFSVSATSSFETNYTNAVRPKANITVSNALTEVELDGAVVVARQVVDSAGTLGATVSALSHDTLSASTMFWEYQLGIYHMTIMPPPGIGLGAVVVSSVDLTLSNSDFGIAFPLDSDGDGLGDNQEGGAVWNSVVGQFDTDGDGLVDGYDGFVTVAAYPGGVDANGDGYVDGERDSAIQTDPGNPDSDGDGASDGAEVAALTDPNDSGSGAAPFLPGDIAPLGLPDHMINAADYLIAVRYVFGQLTVTQDTLDRLDLNSNSGIDAGDLVLLQQLIQSQ